MIKETKITYKPTGEKFWMQYKYVWNTHYFSFDGGETWDKSKIKAFRYAFEANKLQRD